MRPSSVERRLLLKLGLGALLGLANGAALAAILEDDGEAQSKGAGEDLAAAQSRLGEKLMRALAAPGKARAGANLIVSPASVAVILSFIDLGANHPLHAAIHRILGFRRMARGGLEDDLKP